MPRIVRETNISTREARARLATSRKPYFRSLDEGLHLGYRKSHNGSAWVVRWYRGEGSYVTANLDGRPDDTLTADGTTVLNWNQAQALARDFFVQRQREALGLDAIPAGPYTVKNALDDYMKAYARRGGKSVAHTQSTIDGLILPNLGEVLVSKLTQQRIESWHDALANAPPRLRTKAGQPQKFRKAKETPEATRRRRSTANRVLTVLKAALNHAHSARKVATDDAWRRVKAFRDVDGTRVGYLNDEQARKLVQACTLDFRPLVQAALLSGCRYGELIALTAADFNADSGTVHIRISKSGKPRHVVLTEEGQKFFTAVTTNKIPEALVFAKPDGSEWGKNHQQRSFKAACEAAGIKSLTFHELRHTYASRLIMRAVPLAVVAAQLGHSDTRMVEKHYGHLSPNYVADTVRAAFGTMGLLENES